MKKTAFLFSNIYVFRSMSLRKILSFIFLLIIFCSYSAARPQEQKDLSKLVQKADTIIRGKVLSTESQWKEDSQGKHIYTNVTVEVVDRIKGCIENDIFSFELVGGIVDNIREVVSDTPYFENDEDAILFLAGEPLTIQKGINSKIPIYDGKVYRNNSVFTAESFIQAIKILEQDPNAPAFFDEIQVQTAEVAVAECYVYGGCKWPGSSPSISYKINENTSDCATEGAAVQAAANEWNNKGGSFTLQYGGSHTRTSASYNSSNEIMWGTTSDSVATTTTWYIDERILECDVVFNDTEYNWSSTTPSSVQMDVQSVALHEFGHWLLLEDLYNSEDSVNIMYGYIGFGQVRRILQPCDIDGICYIYGGCVVNYTLAVNSSGTTSVSISSSTGHGGITNYTKTVSSGTSVALTAPLSSGGKTFAGWTGDVTGSSQTISFLMNSSKTVTANYVTPVYTLTVNSSGASSVNIGSDTGQGGTTDYTRTVTSGASVNLTAPLTAGGNSFKQWLCNDVEWTNTLTADFTMNADYTFTVVYEQVPPEPTDVDLNDDGTANFYDYSDFLMFWQNECLPPDWCQYRDFNHDGFVNIDDLQILAEFWLWSVTDVNLNEKLNL